MKVLLETTSPFFSRRSMAAASVGKDIYFFGGVGAAGTESILDVANDLWCFDTNTLEWHQVPQHGSWPAARRCVGWVARQEKIYLWGGSGLSVGSASGSAYNFLNDEWIFEPAKGLWRQLKQSVATDSGPEITRRPCPRYTPILQPLCESLFLFGGYTEDEAGKRKLNDAWVLSNAQWRALSPTRNQGYDQESNWPGLRYGAMSASSGREVFIFGGFSDDGDHNDLWSYDESSRRWKIYSSDSRSASVPEARYCGAMDIYEDRLYLFGGRSRRYPKRNFNDLWVYHLPESRWQMISPNREPHIYGSGAEFPAYHAKASSARIENSWYIWGGEGLEGHVSDFWQFNFATHKWEMIQAARNDDPKFW
jgi:N-acetylneuraminic acid mutarotase